MWSVPSKQILSKIPRLYKTEKTPLEEKLIYLHFFIFGSDWYIAEYDGDDLFWGFSILNGDDQNAEWGYISFTEMKEIRISSAGIEIDCETNWKTRKAFEIKKIREAQGWAFKVIKIEDKKVRQKEVHSNRQMFLFN